MKMQKLSFKLPTDIFAIQEIGVKNYQDNYGWPVSDHQFFLIAESVLKAFDDLCCNIGQTERDIILSDTTFLIFLINHIHALSVSEACRKASREIILGQLSKTFYTPDWEKFGLEIAEEIQKGKWRYRFRRHAKNIVFNNHLNIFRRIYGLFSPDALGLGSASRIRQEYLNKNNLSIDNHYWPTLLNQCDFSRGKPLENSLRKRIKTFFSDLEYICSEQISVSFNSSSSCESWIARLTSLNTIYLFLLEKGPSPKLFLMTEPGRSINKVVSHAMKRKGAKTVTFEHGNAFGGLVEKSAAYNGPVNCDEYVCPTTGSANSFRLMYEQTTVSKFHHVHFTSLETDYYYILWKRSQAYSFPKKIQKVMVMGYPMTPSRYLDSPGLLFYLQFDLELRLMMFLKKKGFEVLYKIHPYSMQIARDLFESLGIRIISEPFENVWHQADCFIYKFTSSTTFGFALCTNRPIFLLDQEKAYWQPDHYRMLSRRCRMIPSWTDENNRIQFNEDSLTQELSAESEYPDFGYVNKYMFPKSRQ